MESEEDFSNWKPNISIAEVFGFSEFKEKIFFIDFLLTGNTGTKILGVSVSYPESAYDWIKSNAQVLLSDGYTKLTFDPFTFRLFLSKDGSELCRMNFYKIYRIRNSIKDDLKKAKWESL